MHDRTRDVPLAARNSPTLSIYWLPLTVPTHAGEKRYVEEKALAPPAARRLAEKEEIERRRVWLDVNVHKKWAESPDGQGKEGYDREPSMFGFGRAKGREKVDSFSCVNFTSLPCGYVRLMYDNPRHILDASKVER